jgi:hypothetical protein
LRNKDNSSSLLWFSHSLVVIPSEIKRGRFLSASIICSISYLSFVPYGITFSKAVHKKIRKPGKKMDRFFSDNILDRKEKGFIVKLAKRFALICNFLFYDPKGGFQ